MCDFVGKWCVFIFVVFGFLIVLGVSLFGGRGGYTRPFQTVIFFLRDPVLLSLLLLSLFGLLFLLCVCVLPLAIYLLLSSVFLASPVLVVVVFFLVARSKLQYSFLLMLLLFLLCVYVS